MKKKNVLGQKVKAVDNPINYKSRKILNSFLYKTKTIDIHLILRFVGYLLAAMSQEVNAIKKRVWVTR